MKVYQFVLGYLLPSQFFKTPPQPTASFEGQTVIVTGANTGLGYEAVKHLLRLKAAKIIIAVRTIKKGEAAIERLVAETNCDPTVLEVWQFDLASFDSIRKFVERAQTLDRLDAVIQNAGVAGLSTGTIDGMELLKVVDLLAPLYFAYAILPKLRSSAKKTGHTGRFSFIGSDAMYILDVEDVVRVKGSILDAMDDPAQQRGQLALGMTRYTLVKTLLYYATVAMAEQTPISASSNVIIDIETPGLTITDFGEDRDKPLGPISKWLKSVAMMWIARRAEVGARTYIHAIEPDLTHDAHGRFLMDSQVIYDNPMSASPAADELKDRITKEIMAYLETLDPGLTRI